LDGGSSASNAGNLPFWETLHLQEPKIERITLITGAMAAQRSLGSHGAGDAGVRTGHA